MRPRQIVLRTKSVEAGNGEASFSIKKKTSYSLPGKIIYILITVVSLEDMVCMNLEKTRGIAKNSLI